MKALPFLISLCILLIGALVEAADIPPGSALLASDPNSRWPSPNNTFTLSFIPVDSNNHNSFFAAIAYDAKIPIWKAGGDSGAVDSSGALRFLTNGDLQLTSGTGASSSVIWSSHTAGRGASFARLDDSGNLVLGNATVSNIWSTFDNPTDTIVPSQNFTLSRSLKSGNYSFKLERHGNLTLLWNNSIGYYNSGLNSSANVNLSSPSLRMMPVGILSLFDPSLSSPLNVVYSSDYADEGDILRFVKLDGDGNLRIYSSTKGSGNQTVRWSALTDQCQVFGYCGNLGVCSYTDSGPICTCPSENFEPVDPKDGRKGCKRKVDLGTCSSNASMLQLDHAMFLTYPPELGSQSFSAGISACRLNCLVNSACIASTSLASGAPVQFSYKELHRATKGFKEKLGAGGFGAVYRAVLANRTVAAVKQLEGIEQGEKQFRMEVATISSTHHLNLVRLIGFCSEGRHRLLVYEFMKNGSLDYFLFASEHSGKLLNWEQRYNIALGTARGITYLHEECRDCIVHCDIKPENILLDENYNAKVSDFGLAKLINPKDHRYRTLTSVRGTRGYLAPEWLANLPITSKSDVYSFGMVLLETVSGKRNFEVSAETNQKKFSVWAYEEYEKGNAVAILDKRLSVQEIDMDQLMRVIQVSFWCIQEHPSQRPMMGKVVQMLEGVSQIDRPPAPKAPTEGSISGSSINASSVSALSTFPASAPAPSSASSFQTGGISSSASASARNVERASSSLLQSE